MQNKPNLGITLTIIYLSLISVCFAIYHLIVRFIQNDNQQAMFSNLLAWSATLFATIALLYTFKEWRKQKGSEVLSKLSESIYFNLYELNELHEKIYEIHADNVIDAMLDETDLEVSPEEKELVHHFNIGINNVLKNAKLIYEYTRDEDIKVCTNELLETHDKYNIVRNLIYRGMKVETLTNVESSYIKFNKDDDKDYLDHIDQHRVLSSELNIKLEQLIKKLLKYIFYSE